MPSTRASRARAGPPWLTRVAWLVVASGCGTAQPKLVDAASPVESAQREVESAAGAETGRADVEAPEERGRRQRRESGLVGVSWQWTRFVDPFAGGIDVPAPERYTVVFSENATVAILADCNRGRGTYLLDENELAVRVVAYSDRPCGAGSLSREFVDNLGAASRFYFVDGQLLMSLRWDTGTMEFTPATQ